MVFTRKLTLAALLLMFIVALAPVAALANDNINVAISGQNVAFPGGQGPALVDGRTLVPVRGVFETLGFDVVWDDSTRTAILTSSDYELRITIDSSVFTVNGANHTLDVPAQLIGGRTMVPIRLPLEAVGFNVGWDNGTVLVSAGGGSVQPDPESAVTLPGDVSERALELYLSANKSLENTDSVSMDINAVIDMNIEGDVIKARMNGELELVWRDITKPEFRMDVSVRMDGIAAIPAMDIPAAIYFRDNTAYMNIMGMKMKTELDFPFGELLKATQSYELEIHSAELLEKMLDFTSMREVAGGTEIKVTVSDDEANKMLALFADEISDELFAGSGYKGDLEFVMVIDKDNMLTFMEMTGYMEAYDERASIVLTVSNVKYGGVSINFPADLDDYSSSGGFF